jgi:hypothetical protein
MKSKLSQKDKQVLNEALFDSVCDGKGVELITALLHAGADPNTGLNTARFPGDTKITSLMVASSIYYVPEESQRLINVFVAAGADLAAKDSRGMSLIAYARANCNDSFAEQLKQAKRQKKPSP